MPDVYLIPEWFFDFGVTMEVLFSLVTLAVAIAGIAIYRISKEKSIWRFSLGFLMISISYAIWATLNAHIASKLDTGGFMFSLANPPLGHVLGVYLYVLFFIAGLVTLAYTTLKMEKGEVFYLMLGLSLTAIVSSLSKFVTFRIVSLFLLTFIAYHYFIEWHENKNKKTCWILAAFIMLVISNAIFIFLTSSPIAYVLGHIFELAAYSTLLINLLRMLRK